MEGPLGAGALVVFAAASGVPVPAPTPEAPPLGSGPAERRKCVASASLVASQGHAPPFFAAEGRPAAPVGGSPPAEGLPAAGDDDCHQPFCQPAEPEGPGEIYQDQIHSQVAQAIPGRPPEATVTSQPVEKASAH